MVIPKMKAFFAIGCLRVCIISKSEDILWVSKNVGHKDMSITFKEYARYIDDGNKQRAVFLQDVA